MLAVKFADDDGDKFNQFRTCFLVFAPTPSPQFLHLLPPSPPSSSNHKKQALYHLGARKVNVHVSKSDIQATVIDTTSAAMVRLHLPASYFAGFSCKEEGKVGLNLEALKLSAKIIVDGDSIKMTMDASECIISKGDGEFVF